MNNRIHRTIAYVLSILITSTPVTIFALRHSKTKNRERSEKYVAKKEHSLDLAAILSKQTKDLTFEQACKAREHYSKEKNEEMIAKCAQRMLAVGGDQELMRTARLELADIFLKKGNYKEAEKYALEYQKYYPGASEIKKVSYIAIRANFLSKLSSDRDQEKTRTTVGLAKEFLNTYKEDTEYTPLIKEMLDACYKSLIRAELHVIELQLNSYYYAGNEFSLAAAEKRLAFVQENLAPHVPSAAKKIAAVERELSTLRKKIKATTPGNAENLTDEAPSSTPPTETSASRGYLASAKDYFFEDNESFFTN